jgi:hypothetical protein
VRVSKLLARWHAHGLCAEPERLAAGLDGCLRGGCPEQVTALDDMINYVAWSPDGKWLAFSLAP